MNEHTMIGFADEMEKVAKTLGGSTLGTWGMRALTGGAPGALIGANIGAATAKGKGKKRKKDAESRARKGALIGGLTGAAGGMGIGRFMQHRGLRKATKAGVANLADIKEQLKSEPFPTVAVRKALTFG